jgi:RNA-directed DNA polymerase
MHPSLPPFGTHAKWFSFLRQHLEFDQEQIEIAERLLRANRLPVVLGPELAAFIGISRKSLCHMAHYPDRYYRSFNIPKANGQLRKITAPRIFLKTVQRYILCQIFGSCPIHNAAVGFRRGISLLDGAQRHVKHHYLWNIDLKDFFPTIRRDRVIELFRKLGYPDSAALFLSGLCCLDGRLPQGAPTSPLISNAIFFEIDKDLAVLSNKAAIKYTRYADDLSFSSNKPITKEFRRLVVEIVTSAKFQINRQKTRLIGPAARREVTGLVINERVGIPRQRRRRIRALFHEAAIRPLKFSQKQQQLRGIAAWVSQYHPAEAAQYLLICDQVLMANR